MDSPDNKKRIGDYELLSVLGSGSQGQVYRARCVVSGKEFVQEGEVVAIKILGRSGSTTAAEDARFKREARILESLQHPSICRYIDYFIEGEGEFDERQCLVTEFLDGESLDDRLTRYPKGLPWDEVFSIFEQCIEGLVYAAERDVFHRDLKPSNLYITREGHAKIIDFGIARQEGGEETTSGGFKGSFDYMSPDFVLVDGFRGDMRSDIFSLGVCFYKALTGELPFEALGENAHIGYLNRWKSADAVRPSYRHNAFRVLTRAKPFVTDALAADPEERFHTFQEMLEGLRQIKRRVIRHKGKEDYELLDVLGRGGFGEVYKGRMASNGQLVAVKHLFAGRQASRFVKEAKLLQQYHHPDIVEYVDFIEVEGLGDDKEFFLVMEYLPGMPGAGLNQRIRRSRFGLEPAEVVEIFIHYLSALQFLHENPRPIIHRDIKPGNLYAPVGQPHKAKLFDLGVARDVSGTMTTGMIPGTLDYMAPEFARPGSERGTPQSDIYAMGVTLYESLTGNKPFPRLPKSDQEAFVQFVARAQNPPPVNYGMPVFREISKLEQVLRKSLAEEPVDRYASAGRMLADLEALLEEVSAEAVDQHDAPTRATIADPALIERLRAHQQQRPDRIPESEMRRILDESSSKGDVQQRPDWLMEEGSESRYAAPPTASPTPTPVPVAAPRNTGLKIAAVAALVAALGLGGFMVWRNMPKSGEDIRAEFVDTRTPLSTPQPTEAYVIRLLSMQAQARERKLEDATYEVWWDNEITTISEYGRKVPEAFDQAFRQAIEDGDLAAAEEVRSAWRSVGDAVSFMGLTQREYLEQSDSMRDQIAQFNFTEEVKGLRARLPERISGATDVAAAESVAVGLRSLRSQPWEEVPAEDRDAVFQEIETRLTAMVSDFVTARKEEVLARYGEGLDAGTEADALAELEQSAPLLAALADETYRTALAEVADARGRHERMQAVAATLDRLNTAVPATIRTPGDVVRAEAAAAAYQQEQLADWPGIDPEDKRASLDRSAATWWPASRPISRISARPPSRNTATCGRTFRRPGRCSKSASMPRSWWRSWMGSMRTRSSRSRMRGVSMTRP
jgi:serine/threonine protein kinase